MVKWYLKLIKRVTNSMFGRSGKNEIDAKSVFPQTC